MNLNERIKNYRNENNLTQESLAKKLYVSRSSIAKWEQSRGIPSLDVLSRLAQLMGVTLDDLVGEREIKTLTLENSNKIKRNFFVVKITMIAVLIALVLSSIVLAIILKDSKKEEEEPIVVGHVIFAEITEMVAGNGMSVLTSDQSVISFDGIDMSVDIFSRYGEPMPYENLKVGYYIRLAYANKKLPTNSIENLRKIEVIEDYIDDYEIYGFIISTTEGVPNPMPINLDTLSGNYDDFFLFEGSDNIGYNAGYKYPYCVHNDRGNSGYSGRSDIPTFSTEYGYQTITDRDGREWECISSLDIRSTITIDRAKVDNIWVYVVDNSETGYYLHGEFNNNSCPPINGYLVQEDYKEKKFFEMPYSLAVTYHISIEFVSTSAVTIYEYDKENTLIKEQTFSTYDEYIISDHYETSYRTDENTLYVIVKMKVDYKPITFLLGIGESINFKLSSLFGYVFEITPKIC